ncbi:MAG: indole-3-glycerol phosphate synthase TrpC [candidate division Zixibacteria bacterium]
MMLKKIVSTKKKRLNALDRESWEIKLRSMLCGNPPVISFSNAIAGQDKPTLIAEFKKRSPSAGAINESIDPIEQAILYERGGASAISVLTEEDYFGGCLDDIRRIKSAVKLPILRKDFIFDPLQILEARAFGADAVLLIVGILDFKPLKTLLKEADHHKMDCLCEVRSEAEIDIALSCGARIIGINNRDLGTFKIDLDVTKRLRRKIPENITVVSESGIHTLEDVAFVRRCGVDAILVGSELMKAPNVSQKIAELMNCQLK